ncbi:CLUMA_CG016317, isoform A [Clunio marinus]|uniref:CLUMA_CG016317, isoform A n=1 Tax=Clunio marinus TaxID=568069 RepID=A0A1J1IUD7_9DIPT|nr:CLUMA_CG016317, isoform A [Clunio marinus]
MQTWLIILITILSGLAVFVLLFIIKKKRSEKRHRERAAMAQPSIVIPNTTTVIPSTNRQPAYNLGNPTQVRQFTTVMYHSGPNPTSGQMYPPGNAPPYPYNPNVIPPPYQQQPQQQQMYPQYVNPNPYQQPTRLMPVASAPAHM